MKKQIKIFVAFDNNVEEDIVRFGDFLCGLNAQCANIELSVFKAEKDLCESLEKPISKIKDEIKASDYFLLILGNKIDEYAIDKLEHAIEQYNQTDATPEIHIFVNTQSQNSKEIITSFADGKYEHFVEQFQHSDTLKAKFLIWLRARQKSFFYEVGKDRHGTLIIKVDGTPVSGLNYFDALLNNEDYQANKKKLTKKISQREKLIEESKKMTGEKLDDTWDDISHLASEINVLQEAIDKIEKETIQLYQNYAIKTMENGYDARLKKALLFIEQGEIDKAKAYLDPDASIINLNDISKKLDSINEEKTFWLKIAEKEINILFFEIDRLKMLKDVADKYVNIEKCFQQIEYFQRKFGLELTVLYEYALFLAGQNKHDESLEKYEQNLQRLQKIAEQNEIDTKMSKEEYLKEQADTLNGIAVLQQENNLYEQAEKKYNDSLLIWGELLKLDYGKYPNKYINTLSNIAMLLHETERYEEAEEKYNDALSICIKIAEKNKEEDLLALAYLYQNIAFLQQGIDRIHEADINYTKAASIINELLETYPDKYLEDYAWIWNNIACLQLETNQLDKAEENFHKILSIRKDLVNNNPDRYLWDFMLSYHNLGFLQLKRQKYDEAEINLNEALLIVRKLAKKNSKVYLADEADVLDTLANLQHDTKRYKEAESSYIQALNIRRMLVDNSPSVYLSHVARSLLNLGDLQKDTEQYDEAMKSITESLSIWQELQKKNPTAYLKEYANTLVAMAFLQQGIGTLDKAEENHKKALDIYRKIVENYPEGAMPDFAEILNNLASVQIDREKYEEAEINFQEALSILQGLAEFYPEMHEPRVCLVLTNLIKCKESLLKTKEADDLRLLLENLKRGGSDDQST